MRCTQPMGLPTSAFTFLLENAVPLNPCDHCHRNDGMVAEEVERRGMFDDLPLYRYPLKDGRIATEYVQEEHWSSGPMIWLALRIEGKGETETLTWEQKDISQVTGE